jgi:glycine oxidase
MYQSSKLPRGDSPVSIIGAGIAGAWQALLFAQAGHDVTLHERSDEAMMLSTSHWAGGMLAPYCEARRRTGHQPARPALARSVARELPDTPSTARWWWRIARPRRFRAFCGSPRPPGLDAQA